MCIRDRADGERWLQRWLARAPSVVAPDAADAARVDLADICLLYTSQTCASTSWRSVPSSPATIAEPSLITLRAIAAQLTADVPRPPPGLRGRARTEPRRSRPHRQPESPEPQARESRRSGAAVPRRARAPPRCRGRGARAGGRSPRRGHETCRRLSLIHILFMELS